MGYDVASTSPGRTKVGYDVASASPGRTSSTTICRTTQCELYNVGTVGPRFTGHPDLPGKTLSPEHSGKSGSDSIGVNKGALVKKPGLCSKSTSMDKSL